MQSVLNRLTVFISFAFLTFGFCAARAQNAQNAAQSMRFFVTSVGSGKGGDLGGLAGADAHCQSLAADVGAGARTWHAYLSTQASAGVPPLRWRVETRENYTPTNIQRYPRHVRFTPIIRH